MIVQMLWNPHVAFFFFPSVKEIDCNCFMQKSFQDCMLIGSMGHIFNFLHMLANL